MKKSLYVTAALLLAALLTAAAVPAHAAAEGTEAALPVCETGGRILYGSYEQDGDPENGAEPIEWIVLDAKGGSALLLSRYELAMRPFHADWKDGVEWAGSDLRAWLNGEFLAEAFDAEEAEDILVTELENRVDPAYREADGAPTEDRAFLLSIDELLWYLTPEEDRTALPTLAALVDGMRHNAEKEGEDFEAAVEWNTAQTEEGPALYARQNVDGTDMEVVYRFSEDGGRILAELRAGGETLDTAEMTGADWWLRSMPRGDAWAAYVTPEGALEESVGDLVINVYGIRPAIRIKADTSAADDAAVPPEIHAIPYGEGLDTLDDGDGADAFANSLDHPDTRYYTINDFYNMKSGRGLHILPRFSTYQQTTEYSCGAASALMVLEWFGEREYDEPEICRLAGTDTSRGTSVEGLEDFFTAIGWEADAHGDTKPRFESIEECEAFLIGTIDEGVPVMVDWVDWSGHWMVVIGIDVCGNDDPYDDVLIMADPYDVTDHYQDGYYTVPFGRFFYMWREGPCAEKDVPYEQPYVVARPS